MTFLTNTLVLKQENGGTKVKQGDFGSTFTFTLLDGQGNYFHELNNKVATITLCNDTNIVYETTSTVIDSSVTFNISKTVQIGIFYLEIKIDDYIFPSDRSTIISIEAGAVAYDLKELIPNYDVNMTLDGIKSELATKTTQINTLNSQMSTIYSNALSDHAEILTARGSQSSLDSRLDGLDANDSSLQAQITSNDADIDATNTRINNLVANAGNGTVPSELVDIRVGADGKTYQTAGDAVRNQIDAVVKNTDAKLNPYGSQLISAKYRANNLINKFTLIDGFYINKTGIQTAGNDWSCSSFIDISTSTYINPQSGIGLSSWYDSNKVFISSFTSTTPIKVPDGAKYIRCSILKVNKENACIVDGQRNVNVTTGNLDAVPISYKMPYKDGYIPFTVKVNNAKATQGTVSNANLEGDNVVDVNCHLYLPANTYSPHGKPSKLLMLCHGAGKGAIEWESNESYDTLVKSFSWHGYVVFDCNGYSNEPLGCSFWGEQRGLTAWRNAYKYVVDNYNVETEFSIYAFSMGGLTAMNLAFQNLPNVKAIALGSPVLNLEAVYKSTDGTQNLIKQLYGLGDVWDPSKVAGSNPYANLYTINNVEMVTKSLPPIKIWYGSTETNNIANPSVEKLYAKRMVDAINVGGGTAQYREVDGGVHSLSYGANKLVISEIILFLNRFSS